MPDPTPDTTSADTTSDPARAAARRAVANGAANGTPPARTPVDPQADPGSRQDRRPEGMREAMAHYVHTVHRAYLTIGAGQPPAIRGRMRLVAEPFTVVAAAARNLHVVATTDALAPPRGAEVTVDDEIDGLAWSLRFLDPVVLPELGLVDEGEAPAPDRVRRAVGISTYLYHLIVQPGSQLTDHHAGHAGAGLAQDHLADVRDYDTIRRHAGRRAPLVDEMEGAARAGLPRALGLLAQQLAPRDEAVAELARADQPDPTALRKAVLAAVRPPA